MRELAEFETRYINSMDYKLHNDSIKLIGYKKIQIPELELGDFEDHYFKNQEQWKKIDNTYYDQGAATLRIYFPVQAALVEHGGKLVEANHLGELDMEQVTGDCAVLGRKQTDHVTGVEGNIIKDGIIYLADRNRPERRLGNVHVYDFGIKVIHDHDHDGHHTKRDGKTSCMNNHGGPNCSDKFDIHKGRCPRRDDVCVDYNGIFTNCKKEGGFSKYKNFPGSDCDFALGRGQCWNEIM
jgi:hypothetical protein